jgi:predicted metal-dependent hydrolase
VSEAAFKRGLDAIHARRYFEAHEELEVAWRAAPAGERDFFQGLVHVAVAWYQAGRGRPIATASQLEKASRRLGPYAPAHRGIDIAGVLTQVAAARSRVADGSLDLDPPQLTLQQFVSCKARAVPDVRASSGPGPPARG